MAARARTAVFADLRVVRLVEQAATEGELGVGRRGRASRKRHARERRPLIVQVDDLDPPIELREDDHAT
jgi:hypothetical protein